MTSSPHHNILINSYVMHMRGIVMSQQPVVDNDGNVFAWNGEVYGGVEVYVCFLVIIQLLFLNLNIKITFLILTCCI